MSLAAMLSANDMVMTNARCGSHSVINRFSGRGGEKRNVAPLLPGASSNSAAGATDSDWKLVKLRPDQKARARARVMVPIFNHGGKEERGANIEFR